MSGFRKVSNGQVTVATPRQAFGRGAAAANHYNQQQQMQREVSAPVMYINMFLPLSNGERSRLGDKGIGLTLDNPVHARLIELINSEQLTAEHLGALIQFEIGRPRDPNAEIDFDFSALEAAFPAE
ncbi:hypothetical protein Presley_13 [Acinetobacter phage Presley]|uniref:Uncharacterized protein n=1 Tax=Acinetobacter phage Presley TaxID=1406780 RepID=U5PVR4_9CAUD|nr:hypothetical protein Presley_13 [Acinetobacter phage Presley]AGY48080.1 hypothetical protein Presley_13 [Acinetobacter phage Presley]